MHWAQRGLQSGVPGHCTLHASGVVMEPLSGSTETVHLGPALAPAPKKNPDVRSTRTPSRSNGWTGPCCRTDNAEQMTDPIRQHVDGLVRDLAASGAIRSPAIERAFRRVERHRFIEGFYDEASDERPYVAVDPDNPSPEALERIYSRRALTTRLRDGLPCSSTSMPALVASMLELLELRPGMKVLEIGSGTGYNAALIAEIVGEHGLVVTVDIEDDVVSQTARLLTNAGYRQVRVLAVDGFFGVPGDSPYDRIIATVGCPDISPHWLEQLSPDGQMLIPLRHRDANPLHQLWKEGDGARGRVVGHSGFMQMEGELRVDDYWSSVGWRPPGAGEQVHIGRDLHGFDASRSLLGLAYYMSIRDRRARFFSPSRGCGLTAEGGWVEVSREGVRWLGDRTIAEDLYNLHEEWHSLGEPSLPDYEVWFEPRIGCADERPDASLFLDRKRFRQRVVVKSQP